MDAILKLRDYGQSCWLDNLTRGKIVGGELRRRVVEEGLRGVTSNPSIFSKAISSGAEYDDQIRALVGEGRSLNEIYEGLVIQDIQGACDVLRSVYDESDGEDGFISLEVSPYLAHDAQGTLEEARHLFSAVGRPNCLIKIPGTPACIPVIEQCLYEGINVNITLLFSIGAYEAVAHAYLRALERRLQEGKPLRQIASVASFFLSRIDVLVDQLLGHRLSPGREVGGPVRPEQLFGKAAIASAKLAYQSFSKIFAGDRWLALEGEGARVQRPLWASTSTKDPLYPDTLYVTPLIGPHTVNTMPEETITAFADHGICEENTIESGIDDARRTMGELELVGIDIDAVTRQLVDEGIQKFIDPFDKLMSILAAKREKVLGAEGAAQRTSPAASGSALKAALESMSSKQFHRRLVAKDPLLWTQDPRVAETVRNRLGWIDCIGFFRDRAVEINQFATAMQERGLLHIVLAGMGGSSLCAEVCRLTFGTREGWPDLIVLDNTDPAAVRRVMSRIEPEKTLLVVASKSGTTTETAAFARCFYEHFKRRLGDAGAAERFVAITDPATPLVEEARRKGFHRVFENPPDIGGRYAALSYFGLVPMGLIGIDVEKILSGAEQVALSSGAHFPPQSNTSIVLGALLAVNQRQGRDKVTFIISPTLRSLGAWIEQLLAESTGKMGTGLIPIEGENLGKPEVYDSDRVFVAVLNLEEDSRKLERRLALLEKAGHPVVRIELKGKYDLGGEFLRWELATAVAGALMGVNPFDEPNVSESKNNTRALLEEWQTKGSLEDERPLLKDGDAVVYADRTALWFPEGEYASMKEILSAYLRTVKAPNYVGLLAYFAATPRREKALQAMRSGLRDGLRVATTLGYGPRYLHSTGQLHKGGPDTGVFLMLTAAPGRNLAIPGERHGFAVLQQAQALGDYRALCSKGRRVIRIHFEGSVEKGLARLSEALA